VKINYKITLIICVVSIAVFFVCSGCSKNLESNDKNNLSNDTTNSETKSSQDKQGDQTVEKEGEVKPPIDLSKVKPNESGKIMVVMFHNFIEEYESGDKEYTTTFDDFRKLLETLYEKDYRLISLRDYLDNNITVPAGCIPMVFTFDDATSGQFNLIEDNGRLIANPNSAVGILEEFNKSHPDFGLEGTFYVNLGLGTFEGKGTLTQRLKYLIDKGFEIGNHTLNHIELNTVKSAEKIQQEIGGNYNKMLELVPGYKMNTFSLPYGLPSSELKSYVAKGEFEGVKYENLAILEVGWNPALSPVNKEYNPLSLHRVRASGIIPVDMDLAWWLKNLSREEQYISDGDPNTITIPKEKEHLIDKERLNGRTFRTY
jgi:hypothetical protein